METEAKENFIKYLHGVPLSEDLSDLIKIKEFLRLCPDFPLTESAIERLIFFLDAFVHRKVNYQADDVKNAWLFMQHSVSPKDKEWSIWRNK